MRGSRRRISGVVIIGTENIVRVQRVLWCPVKSGGGG